MNPPKSKRPRRSWQRQQSSNGPWPARISLSLLALILLGLLVWWLWPDPPAPKVNVVMLNGSAKYHQGILIPPMYSATALKEFERVLKLESNTSKDSSAEIGNAIAKIEVSEESEDTHLVVIRGYFLFDSHGTPSIASSDLAFERKDGEWTGLVPLSEMLGEFTEQPHRGNVVVILDIEPFGVLPHFDVEDPKLFEQLNNTVAGLEGVSRNRLWVLATRGPFQNPGWSVERQLPVSSMVLLDGLAGKAKSAQENTTVTLSELVRYMAKRYRQIGTVRDYPQPILFQGGAGAVDQLPSEEIIVAYVDPPKKESKPVEKKKPSDQESNDGKKSSTASRNDLNVTTVALVQDTSDESTAVTGGSDATAAAGENTSAADTDATNSETAPPEKPKTFWQLRDEFESWEHFDSLIPDTRLHPVSVAPHLWQKVVSRVLHSEIELLDKNATSANRTNYASQVTKEIAVFMEQIRSPNPSPSLVVDGHVVDSNMQELYTRWIDANNQLQRRITSGSTGERIRLANQVQHEIALLGIHCQNVQLFKQQAIFCDADHSLTDVPPDSYRNLIDTFRQEPSTSELQGLLKTIDTTRGPSKEKVRDHFHGLLRDDKNRAATSSGWSLIKRYFALIRSPVLNGEQRVTAMNRLSQLKIREEDRRLPSEASIFADLSNGQNSSAIKGWLRSYHGNVGSADQSFAEQLVVSIETDARHSTNIESAIVHEIQPAPRARVGSVTVTPSQEKTGAGLPRFVDVTINPDAEKEVKVKVSYSISDSKHVSARWSDQPDESFIERTIEGSGISTEKLELRLQPGELPDTDQPLNITFQVKVIEGSDHFENQPYPLSLTVQSRNQIHAIVKSDLLTREIDTSSDSESGTHAAVYLESANSHETGFRFQLFNASQRPCKVKVWLVELPSPFKRINNEPPVDGFSPNRIIPNLDVLDQSLRDSITGRVNDVYLTNAIKGPKVFTVSDKPVSIDWSKTEPEGEASPASSDNDDAAAKPFNFTTGFGLVIRMMDGDNEKTGKDQIRYLIPRPINPERFIDSMVVKYADGEVSISGIGLKNDVDGDGKDERHLPEMVLRYVPDAVCLGTSKKFTIAPGRPMQGIIKFKVARGTGPIEIRLGLDDWSRSIRRWIERSNNAEASDKPQDGITRSRIDVHDASIQSGDEEPIIYDFPKSLAFPSKASAFAINAHADFGKNKDLPQDARVEFSIDGQTIQTHYADRIYLHQARATDDGLVAITTNLRDFSHQQTINNTDDFAQEFQWTLYDDANPRNASTTILVDNTPPSIDLNTVLASNTRKVGDEQVINIRASDPGDAASGVAEIKIALEDKFQDEEFKPYAGRETFKITFTEAGTFKIKAQVRDRVQNESEVQEIEIKITEKPDDTPKPKPGTISGRIDHYTNGNLQLIAEGGVKSTARINPSDKGSFRFEDVDPGTYSLIFAGSIGSPPKTRKLKWEGIKPGERSQTLKMVQAIDMKAK